MIVTPTSLSCYYGLKYKIWQLLRLEYFIIFHFPVSEKIFFSQIGQSIVLYILA